METGHTSKGKSRRTSKRPRGHAQIIRQSRQQMDHARVNGCCSARAARHVTNTILFPKSRIYKLLNQQHCSGYRFILAIFHVDLRSGVCLSIVPREDAKGGASGFHAKTRGRVTPALRGAAPLVSA